MPFTAMPVMPKRASLQDRLSVCVERLTKDGFTQQPDGTWYRDHDRTGAKITRMKQDGVPKTIKVAGKNVETPKEFFEDKVIIEYYWAKVDG